MASCSTADKVCAGSLSALSGGGDAVADLGVAGYESFVALVTAAAAVAGGFHAALGGAGSAGATALAAGPQPDLGAETALLVLAVASAASPAAGFPQAVFCCHVPDVFLAASLLPAYTFALVVAAGP